MDCGANTNVGVQSGDSASPVSGCVTAHIGNSGTAADAGQLADGDALRQWTVVAVTVEPERVVLLPIGFVMAADLELAADQVCGRVPAPTGEAGALYLVASPCTLEVDAHAGRIVTLPQMTWVNEVAWGGAAWELNEWVPAEDGLGRLDPACWRGVQLARSTSES